MSVICTIYVPEGIVMAAESRMTITATMKPKEDNAPTQTSIFSISDNAQKVVLLNKVKIGISACGAGILDEITIADYIRIFEIQEVNPRDGVMVVADKLRRYSSKNSKMVQFHVAGYNDDEPFYTQYRNNECKRLNHKDGQILYGAAWNGEPVAINKLLSGQPNMQTNFKIMPLKDAVDFADFLIETTIKYQRFEMKPKTCGGDIDVLVLTKDEGFWHRHKVFKPRSI